MTIKHFDVPDGDIPFTIGRNSLHAYGAIPADDFAPFIGAVSNLGAKDDNGDSRSEEAFARQVEALERAIGLCMPESSRIALRAGMASGSQTPITWKVLTEVLNWLMGKYGLSEDDDSTDEGDGSDGVRPLEATSASPDTSSVSGEGSAES